MQCALSVTNIRIPFVRHYKKKIEGAVRYGLIQYFPKHPDEKDPEYTPTKLFRVQRIKPVKGNPYWEKRILRDLGLVEKQSDVAIVKNIPEMNATLWKIKHLIKVTPIVFPYGEPTIDDIHATFLKDDGVCIVHKSIAIDEKRIEKTEEFVNDKLKLDPETLKKDSRLKWVNPWV